MKNRINFDEYIIKDTSESETNPTYYSVDNISSSSYKTPVSDSFLNLRKHMFYYSIIPNNSRLELLAPLIQCLFVQARLLRSSCLYTRS